MEKINDILNILNIKENTLDENIKNNDNVFLNKEQNNNQKENNLDNKLNNNHDIHSLHDTNKILIDNNQEQIIIQDDTQQEILINNNIQEEILIENNKEEDYWTNFDDSNFNTNFNIKIFGIGGAGCNVVNLLIKDFDSIKKYAKIYALNTDVNALKGIKNVKNKFLLGKDTLMGHGSGGKPDIGKQSVIDNYEVIKQQLKNTDILFIIAGMGKGTGSGASPEIAKIAKELGILTVGIINMPSLACEGNDVYKNAFESFNVFVQCCDSITTISNEKIINNNMNQLSFFEAYNMANNEIGEIIEKILNLIYIPTSMNIDFADIKNFFKNNKYFYVNGIDLKSDYDCNKLKEVINDSIKKSNSDISLDNSKHMLVNIFFTKNISSSITIDIRKIFSEISKNNEISLVNGIDYLDEQETRIKCDYFISGSMIKSFNDHPIKEDDSFYKTSKLFDDEALNPNIDELE